MLYPFVFWNRWSVSKSLEFRQTNQNAKYGIFCLSLLCHLYFSWRKFSPQKQTAEFSWLNFFHNQFKTNLTHFKKFQGLSQVFFQSCLPLNQFFPWFPNEVIKARTGALWSLPWIICYCYVSVAVVAAKLRVCCCCCYNHVLSFVVVFVSEIRRKNKQKFRLLRLLLLPPSLSLLRGQCSVLLRPGSNIFAPSSDDWDDDFVDLLLSGLRSLVPKTAWLYVFILVKYMFWFELKTVKWCENTKNDRFWQIMFHGAVPESTALGLLDFPIIKVRFFGELLKS